MEGRGGESYFANVRERETDREEGAHTGRNPKLLKHRRMHVLERTHRQLLKNDFLNARGETDFQGLRMLADAEHEKNTMGGPPPIRHQTLKELDQLYPTPEGNVRLGLAPPESLDQGRNISQANRWERSSHYVQFRKPGSVEEILPDEMINYVKDSDRITIFVHGSLNERYPFSVKPFLSIGDLKTLVWQVERYVRHEMHGLKSKDEEQGFVIEKQVGPRHRMGPTTSTAVQRLAPPQGPHPPQGSKRRRGPRDVGVATGQYKGPSGPAVRPIAPSAQRPARTKAHPQRPIYAVTEGGWHAVRAAIPAPCAALLARRRAAGTAAVVARYGMRHHPCTLWHAPPPLHRAVARLCSTVRACAR